MIKIGDRMKGMFFRGIEQAESRILGRKIRVPIFYDNASSITALFPAWTRRLREILPTPAYHPLSLVPGIGVLAVTALRYRKSDIGPYNELSISVPISYKSRSLVPGLRLLSSFLRGELHVFIRHLPVTTKIALDGGVIVYNYPKFLAAIGFDDRSDALHVTLDEKGERILSLTGVKIPAVKKRVMRYITYPVKDGKPHEAAVLINARKFGISMQHSAAVLELGERHPVARELRRVLLSVRPIGYQYVPDFQAVLYGPVRLD